MDDSTLAGTSGPLVRLRNSLLQPRSSNRDEAFRERMIRVVITIIALASVGVLIWALLIHDSLAAIIVRTLAILTIAMCAAAGIAISRHRITTAGVLLVLIFLVGGVCLILQSVVESGAALAL